MIRCHDENPKRQIAVAAAILLALTALVCGALIGWRFLPGILGDWLGTIIGVMTTPFFLEASFVLIGFTLVLALNTWRRRRDGDELVYLERVDGPDVPRDMPDQAKWAVYPQVPLDGETPSLQVQAEGALEIGDFATAADCLAAMPEEELRRPEILALRRDLAMATGKTRLAEELEAEMRQRSS